MQSGGFSSKAVITTLIATGVLLLFVGLMSEGPKRHKRASGHSRVARVVSLLTTSMFSFVYALAETKPEP
jgi:hypothetical protein